jgi:hypothetical protein
VKPGASFFNEDLLSSTLSPESSKTVLLDLLLFKFDYPLLKRVSSSSTGLCRF